MKLNSLVHLTATGAVALAIVGVLPGSAKATLTLTAAGVADGFSLSTFATIDPGNTGFGPFGLAVNNNNQVIVSDSLSGSVFIFNDVDGQTTASALFTHTGAGTGTVGMTATGGFYYGNAPGGGNFGGTFTRYNPDGTVNSSLSGVPYHPYLGMAATPSGHIIATTDSGNLIDIDPTANGGTGSARVIANVGSGFDGVSISPDGTDAIIENSGSIQVYDIATGAQVGPTYSVPNSPDGTGAISGGLLNGDIIVNTNGGTIELLDPTTSIVVEIATGGTRGDYTAVDPNGTLLLDYSDVVERLTCSGCTIGSPPPPPGVPEPATLGLLGAGLAAIGTVRRRKRN